MSGPITTRSLVVGQAWSTVFELYFYFLFALLLFAKKPNRHIVYFIVLFSILGYGYRFLGFSYNGFCGFFSSIMGSSHNLFFIEGVVLAMCYKKGWLKIRNKTLYYTLFINVMLICVWCMTHTYNQMSSIFLSPIVFIGFLLLNDFVKIKSWWNKALSFCGDISFSIYLVHCLVITITIDCIGISNVSVVFFLSLALTITISTIIYILLEKPFILYSKRLIDKIK